MLDMTAVYHLFYYLLLSSHRLSELSVDAKKKMWIGIENADIDYSTHLPSLLHKRIINLSLSNIRVECVVQLL
jgi:hypothetical protein